MEFLFWFSIILSLLINDRVTSIPLRSSYRQPTHLKTYSYNKGSIHERRVEIKGPKSSHSSLLRSFPFMRLSNTLIRPSRSLTRSPNSFLRRHIKPINLSPFPSICLFPAYISKIPRRMPHIIDRKHNNNKARLEDIEVPLVRVQIPVEASREFDHAVDGAEEDHGRASVDSP